MLPLVSSASTDRQTPPSLLRFFAFTTASQRLKDLTGDIFLRKRPALHIFHSPVLVGRVTLQPENVDVAKRSGFLTLLEVRVLL